MPKIEHYLWNLEMKLRCNPYNHIHNLGIALYCFLIHDYKRIFKYFKLALTENGSIYKRWPRPKDAK